MLTPKCGRMTAFFQLMRPLNLMIMAATMYCMRYFIMDPLLRLYKLDLQMSDADFGLLVLSVVLLAASGYIINDYFDIRADRINKNGKVLVGRLVKRRVAMAAHLTMNILGVGIGFYVAWQVGIWKLSLIHLFAAGSLWYYSVMFKKELLIGNFVIAAITGVVPLIPAIFEVPLLVAEYGQLLSQAFPALDVDYTPTDYFSEFFYWTGGFASFAFILTLIREVQKDMADVEGDKAVGCKTIPIRLGFDVAKAVIIVLTLLVLAAIVLLQQDYLIDSTSKGYIYLFIFAPLLVSLVLTVKAKTRKRFLLLSGISKGVMIAGILYSIICYEMLTALTN